MKYDVKLLLIETSIIDIIKNEMYHLKQQFSILIVVLLIKMGMKSASCDVSIQIEEMNWKWKVILSSEWRKVWCLQTQPRMSVSSSKSSTGRQRLHSLLERTYCTDWRLPLSSGLGLMTYNYCEYDISKKYFNVKTYFWRIDTFLEKNLDPSMNSVVVMKLV